MGTVAKSPHKCIWTYPSDIPAFICMEAVSAQCSLPWCQALRCVSGEAVCQVCRTCTGQAFCRHNQQHVQHLVSDSGITSALPKINCPKSASSATGWVLSWCGLKKVLVPLPHTSSEKQILQFENLIWGDIKVLRYLGNLKHGDKENKSV